MKLACRPNPHAVARIFNPPENLAWVNATRANLSSLRRAGVTGNFLTFAFNSNPHAQPQSQRWKRSLNRLIRARPSRAAMPLSTGSPGTIWIPAGCYPCMSVFDYRNTDNASAHFVCFVHNPRERPAVLHTGWDDGILIKFGDQVLFDGRHYPEKGKGLLYRDKYQFEKHIPFTLPRGRSQLSVSSLNSHGNWLFSLRITEENSTPFPDLKFRLE